MAKDKDDGIDIKALLKDELRKLSPEDLRELLGATGAVPTTMGMTPETLQSIVTAMSSVSQTAVRETIRQERKENPSYPQRSVFHPAGVFDDSGKALPPKVKLRRPTYFQGVRLGGELETELEIELLNRFTEDKTSRDGLWSATFQERGTPRERLYIKIPSLTADDRMENSLPLPLILRELLDGADAVNPETLQKQIAQLEAKVKALESQTQPAA